MATIELGLGADAMRGDLFGPNTLSGQAGNDTLEGGDFNDLLEGQLDDDRLFGAAGNDTLIGGRGQDALMGGSGDDWLDGGVGNDWLDGNEGNDTLFGGDGNDFLLAGPNYSGAPQYALLQGGSGNDSLTGEVGANVTYIGGTGDDTITERAGYTGTIVVGLNTGNDLINLEASGATIQLEAGILPSDVRLISTYDITTLSLINGSSVVRIASYRGQLGRILFDNGTIWMRDAIDALTNSQGTAGSDVYTVLRPGQVTHGGDGADMITAMVPGSLYGDAGDDALTIYDFNSGLLDGGDGRDWLLAQGGKDTLIGGRGDDTLTGGPGLDTYFYNPGDGHDRIQEDDWSTPSASQEAVDQAAIVRMGAGIQASDLLLYRDQNDLILHNRQILGDELRLADYFVHVHTQPVVQFADGYWLTDKDIAVQVTPVPHPDNVLIQGGSGNDALSLAWGQGTLVGGLGDDTLDASHAASGLARSTLDGGDGADTYLWGLDSGNVTVAASPLNAQGYPVRDILQFGPGINPGSLTLRVLGQVPTQAYEPPRYTGMEISIAGHDGTLTLLNDQSGAPTAGMPLLQFEGMGLYDAFDLFYQQFRQDPELAAWLSPMPADHYAEQGTVYGGIGADTYYIGLHNGITEITPTHTPLHDDGSLALSPYGPRYDNEEDKLVFDKGIRPQDIEVTAAMPDFMAGPVSTLDITLKVRHTDRQILLRDYPLQMKEDSEVDGIWFNDGTYWSRDDLLSLVNLPDLGPYSPRMPWHDGINLMGGGGNDRIEGEDGHDWLRGSYGRDTLVGGAGNDTMEGGEGNDTYVVDNPADIVYEQEGPGTGKDVIWASCDYNVPTNVETIVLTGKKDAQAQGRATLGTGLVGNDGNNVLIGGTGRDTLNGGFGNDTLFGGEGSDYYYAIDEGDVIVEPDNANDFDVLASMTDHVTMADHIEAVFLKTDSAYAADGNAQENWMYGRASGSWFDGKAGGDHLFGGTGEDVLIGGEDDDELLGDAGNDLYIHRAGDGFDTLRDTDKTGPNTDTLNWEGVSKEQLWFSHVGNDLKVQVLGSAEGVLIQDWYLGAPFQIERQTVGQLTLTSDRVDALVHAMSTVAMPSTKLGNLSPAQQSVILQTMSAAWQG